MSADAHSFDEWIQLFSLFYPPLALPADWAWPRDTLDIHLKHLDKEDTTFFCIVADLSDRLTAAISPLNNPAVLQAYKTYFAKPRNTRCFADHHSLVTVILNESKIYRRGLPETKQMMGKVLLEWCNLADACNQSTLSGTSQANILRTHLTEEWWRSFTTAATHFCNAVSSTNEREEKEHFDRAVKAMRISKAYRPVHIYRLVCFVMRKEDSHVDVWFKVDIPMRNAFATRLPAFLASCAACQCFKVPRTAANFAFLSKVAEDRLGFLRLAADLDETEQNDIKHLIHFGPYRFIQSTTQTGLLHRAFAAFRK